MVVSGQWQVGGGKWAVDTCPDSVWVGRIGTIIYPEGQKDILVNLYNDLYKKIGKIFHKHLSTIKRQLPSDGVDRDSGGESGHRLKIIFSA